MLRRHAGQSRISHRLRNQDRRHAETRDDVSSFQAQASISRSDVLRGVYWKDNAVRFLIVGQSFLNKEPEAICPDL